MMPGTLRRALIIAGVSLAAVSAAEAAPARPAPALPPPHGRIVTVSTEAQLQTAVFSVHSQTTIMIAAGIYRLTRTLAFHGPLADVALRGSTGNAGDVVLLGPGMTSANGGAASGIWTGGGVRGLTIANLTVRDFNQHAVIFNAGTASPRLYNVRLVDAGQQFVKANPDAAGRGVDDGVVEYAVIEYETTSRDGYTNGIDVHAGRNWTVRHSLFRNIRAPRGALAGPAILMWNGSTNATVDGNTFIDCQREIAFGLTDRAPFDHSGGAIRDNVIARDAAVNGDVAIGVFASPDTQVIHNTIRIAGTYANAIEYRFARTTNVVIRGNTVDAAIRARDGATATVAGNTILTRPRPAAPPQAAHRAEAAPTARASRRPRARRRDRSRRASAR